MKEKLSIETKGILIFTLKSNNNQPTTKFQVIQPTNQPEIGRERRKKSEK